MDGKRTHADHIGHLERASECVEHSPAPMPRAVAEPWRTHLALFRTSVAASYTMAKSSRSGATRKKQAFYSEHVYKACSTVYGMIGDYLGGDVEDYIAIEKLLVPNRRCVLHDLISNTLDFFYGEIFYNFPESELETHRAVVQEAGYTAAACAASVNGHAAGQQLVREGCTGAFTVPFGVEDRRPRRCSGASCNPETQNRSPIVLDNRGASIARASAEAF